MIQRTITLPVEKAAAVQNTASEFNCTVLNIAVASNETARVSICGESEDMKSLFESIEEPFAEDETVLAE